MKIEKHTFCIVIYRPFNTLQSICLVTLRLEKTLVNEMNEKKCPLVFERELTVLAADVVNTQ